MLCLIMRHGKQLSEATASCMCCAPSKVVTRCGCPFCVAVHCLVLCKLLLGGGSCCMSDTSYEVATSAHRLVPGTAASTPQGAAGSAMPAGAAWGALATFKEPAESGVLTTGGHRLHAASGRVAAVQACGLKRPQHWTSRRLAQLLKGSCQYAAHPLDNSHLQLIVSVQLSRTAWCALTGSRQCQALLHCTLSRQGVMGPS